MEALSEKLILFNSSKHTQNIISREFGPKSKGNKLHAQNIFLGFFVNIPYPYCTENIVISI
jgi:hypothetical protein